MKALSRSRKILTAGLIMLLMVILFFPQIHRDLTSLQLALIEPGDTYWLGSDILGRSVARESWLGLQASVRIAAIVSILCSVLGGFVGLMAAHPGRYSLVLNRLIDIALAMPGLLVALVLTAMLGPKTQNVILAFAVLGWTGYAKVVRGEALRVRSLEFVEAARTIGIPGWRIDWGYVLPQTLHVVVVQFCFGFAAVMLGESTLAYLGLGDPTLPTLGKQISEGVDYMRDHAYLVAVPGAVLASIVLLLNWLGDQLQHARRLT